MLQRRRSLDLVVLFALTTGAAAAACGSSTPSGSGSADGSLDAETGTVADATSPDLGGDVNGISFETGPLDADMTFDVEPSTLQTLVVTAGSSTPTLAFQATLGGVPVKAAWAIDRGELGTITPTSDPTGTFTPTGTTGGLATISAAVNGKTLTRQVFVKLTATQNGANPAIPSEQTQVPTSVGQLTSGGGVGGVGGEGLGGPVTDGPSIAALGAPSGDGSAQGLKFLYPYDATVFPRGLLAPLVMWDWTTGDADAIELTLATKSGSFSWSGTFSRPAILGTTGGKFVRQPIPQDVWDMATNSAGGPTVDGSIDRLTVSLLVAKGDTSYGPITETWTIAPARLSGTIYYNSYGTQLAKNYSGAVGGDGTFGAAVLSIHVGDTAPTLVAGTNDMTNGCRVCHSVAANGSRLIVQQADDTTSSEYALSPTGATESGLAINTTFPAMFPDGSMALSESGQLLPLPDDSTPTATTGLTTFATDLGSPAFAPNGALVAFNPMAGSGPTTPTQQLYVMTFDAKSGAFTLPTLVVDDTGKPAETRPGWPAFLPDAKSLVFHHQSAAGLDGNAEGQMTTRKGAKAQIGWTSATDAAHVTTLNALNGLDATGTSYLPTLTTPITMSCLADLQEVGNIDPDHGDDVDVNYEPTVNPVASGGYAWVVFTSRRLYGSEATIPPFCSDPRGVDLVSNITPKKLWVAAIDLGAAPGTDASHPAFYLPAQELLAGNSRGFWVLDPCRMDGATCTSGDECCDGYCEPDSTGALTCSNPPPMSVCSGVGDKCATAGDCCDPTNLCVNGFCAEKGPS
jgi:hypothetical protein